MLERVRREYSERTMKLKDFMTSLQYAMNKLTRPKGDSLDNLSKGTLL